MAIKGEDYYHTYLIGLKYFTTGVWPYWGPDVVHTQSQIPGALEGLLVGGPFYLWAHPASPIIFLNLLSFASLTLLGAYLVRKFPGVPAWFIWMWVWFSPWTLNFSTTPINPSYLLVMAIPFWIVLLDGYAYGGKSIRPGWVFFIIGFAIGWAMQLHLSWVLMPCLAFPLFIQMWKQRGWKFASGLALIGLAGMLISLSTLYPTLIRYSDMGSGGVGNNVVFQTKNLGRFFDLVFRCMGFASYEIRFFIMGGAEGEMQLIRDHWWMAPLLIIVFVAGLAQCGFYIVNFFLRNNRPEWKVARRLTAGALILLYVSYLFSIRSPGSFTFYLLLPLIVWYACFSWQKWFRKKLLTRAAVVVVAANLVVHGGFALEYAPKVSTWAYGENIRKSIEEKDSRHFGYRRVANWELAMRDRTWTREAFADNGEQVVRYHQDFEFPDAFIRPEYADDSTSFKGTWADRVRYPFTNSMRLKRSVSEIGDFQAISVSVASLCVQPNNASLDIYVTGSGKELYAFHGPLCSDGTVPGNWQQQQFGVHPEQTFPPDAVVEVFVNLNGDAGEVWVDELNVEFR